MHISCVILAGGRGERLRPITETRPKPLCPVGGASCLARAVAKVRAAGISEITAAAHYRADMIEAEAETLGISVVREPDNACLGTAGAVAACKPRGEYILVVSGDTVSSFDFASLVSFHIKSGLPVTVAVTRSPYPTSFGTVTARDGVITRFSEKPDWRHVTTDIINSGIYVLSCEALSMIPAGVPYDFSSDLFPAVMASSRIGAWEGDGEWCDIGDPATYYECCMRYSGGRNSISPDAVVKGKVTASVVMEGAYIAEGAVVDRSVICENAVIGKNALVPANCVIGGSAEVREGAVLPANTLYFGAARRLFGGNDRISSERFGVSDGIRLGAALGNGGASVGVMSSPEVRPRLVAEAVGVGVRAAGGKLTVLGDGFPALAAFSADAYSADRVVYADSTGIRVFRRDGTLLCGKEARETERAYLNRTDDCVHPGEADTPSGFSAPTARYKAELAAKCGGLSAFPLSFAEPLTLPEELLSEVVRKAKPAEQAAGVSVSADGSEATLVLPDGTVLTFWQLVCLCVVGRGAKTVSLGEDAPDSVVAYLGSRGIDVVPGSPDTVCRDGAMLIAELAGRLAAEGKTPEALAENAPRVFVSATDFEYDSAVKAEKTHALCEECGSDSGVVFCTEHGSVRITPAYLGGFRIVAEAVSAEYAEELCEFGKTKLK